MRLKRVLPSLLMVICLFSVGLGYPAAASQTAEGQVIRIHVVAHSDIANEQELKLLVRDRVLQEIGLLVAGAKDSEEAKQIIETHLSMIKEAVYDELAIQGADHSLDLQWGRFLFPSRVYGSTALPAGTYQALNVIIGAGQGRNWWCIMYPPLCYVDGVVARGNETRYQFAVLNFLHSLWQRFLP